MEPQLRTRVHLSLGVASSIFIERISFVIPLCGTDCALSRHFDGRIVFFLRVEESFASGSGRAKSGSAKSESEKHESEKHESGKYEGKQ